MFKTPTNQQITDKAIELIELNGLTTNLEIKTALRKDGFWVFQSDISKAMNEDYATVGLELTNNGSFNTYFKATPTDEDDDDGLEPFITTVDEDDDDEPVIKVTTVSTDEDGEPLIEPEVVAPKKTKVVGDPEFIGDNAYLLVIEHDGELLDLIVSKEINLPKSFGVVVYEIKSKNGGDNWYLYSAKKEILTRHMAVNFVWKVLKSQVDSSILYFDLRSTRLNK